MAHFSVAVISARSAEIETFGNTIGTYDGENTFKTYLGVGLRRRLTLAKVFTKAFESLLCPAAELSAADAASAGLMGNI